MKIQHRGREPKVDSSAYIAPTAVLARNVDVGADSRIMYGAVLDSEASIISIGASTIVCENVVIRATGQGDIPRPVVIDDHVFIGPHATLLGCTLAGYVHKVIDGYLTRILRKRLRPWHKNLCKSAI